MALLPRNVSAEGVPEKQSGRLELVRRYELTVEREFVVLRTGPETVSVPTCPECGETATMLPPDAVAEAAGISPLTVYRWILERRVHFLEAGPGKLFVCSQSLQALQRADQIAPGEPQ